MYPFYDMLEIRHQTLGAKGKLMKGQHETNRKNHFKDDFDRHSAVMVVVACGCSDSKFTVAL